MKRSEIIRILQGMLVVNTREAEAVREACRILEETDWRDAETDPPEVDEDGASEFVLLSFSNAPGILCIGRYEVDEDGGAYYDGDDEEPLSKVGIFTDGWMPLPKSRTVMEKIEDLERWMV